MTTWEEVCSAHSLNRRIALDSGKLILPATPYAYACVNGEPYMSVKVDTETNRLGLEFSVDPRNQG